MMMPRSQSPAPRPHGLGYALRVMLGLRRPAPEGGVLEEETFGQRAARLTPPVTLLSLALSLAVHLVLSLVALFILVGGLPGGESGAPEGGRVEFAVAGEMSLAAAQGATLDVSAPAAPEAPLVDMPALELLDTPTLGDVGPGLIDATIEGGGGGAGDIGGGTGLGVTGAGSGGGGASFFGAEAVGTHFAYIIDVSGSMGYGGKLEAMKRELARSLSDLMESGSFFVAPYSSDARPLGGKVEWTAASDAGKAWVRKQIDALGANGGTEPYPGFQMVFSLRPLPDAIFFMTDGEFNPIVAVQVAQLNAERRIPIHCVALVSKDSEPLMRRIAQDSGGSYTYVAGPGP